MAYSSPYRKHMPYRKGYTFRGVVRAIVASVLDSALGRAFQFLLGGAGETCTFIPANGGPSQTISVIWSTSPPTLFASDDQGVQQDKTGTIQVSTSDVPFPSRGDVYQLFKIHNAGFWAHNRIEKRNGARWLISIRIRSHQNVGGYQQVSP